MAGLPYTRNRILAVRSLPSAEQALLDDRSKLLAVLPGIREGGGASCEQRVPYGFVGEQFHWVFARIAEALQ